MSALIPIGILFVYLLVGGLLMMRLDLLDNDIFSVIFPAEISVVLMIACWPLFLCTWLIFSREPPQDPPIPTKQPVVIGRSAVTLGDLRPMGAIDINGVRYEGMAEHGFIRAGEAVTVVCRDGLNLVVRQTE